MIYTIGHCINYRAAFKKYGQLTKVGRRAVGSSDFPEGYSGGYAFRTYADAFQRIAEAGYSGFEVFGLITDWENTAPSVDGWWHNLVEDAHIAILEDKPPMGQNDDPLINQMVVR